MATKVEEIEPKDTMVDQSNKKRPASEAVGSASADADVESPKKLKSTENEVKDAANLSSDERRALLKKQIEYYFSDDNMRTDKFFHKKITDDSEHWLDVAHILSCKKIRQLNATKEDIIKALEKSHLEVRDETTAEGKTVPAGVRRKEPLPPLEPGRGNPRFPFERRNHQKGPKISKSSPSTPQNIHTFGCLLKVSEIPSEASWNSIKDALYKAIEESVPADVVPEGAQHRREAKDNPSGRPSYSKFIRFVSQINPGAECLVYLRKFKGDQELLNEKVKEIELGDSKLPVSLVQEVGAAVNFFETQLSPALKKERDREFNRAKCELLNKPITLGGTDFKNVEHLRKCYKELLQVTPLNTEVKPAAFTVLKALLAYHPRAEEKCRDIVAIKVARRADVPFSENSRCFFLLRSDGSSEDFSTNKCMENLSMNPPIAGPVAKKDDKVKEEATPSPTTSSTTDESSPPPAVPQPAESAPPS